MKRKPHNTSPLSLFAFQDIITSVTGVFLLITLLMALELTTRRTVSSEPVLADAIDELHSEVAQAEARVKQLRSTVESRAGHDSQISEFTEASANSVVEATREEIRLLTEKIAQLRQQQAALEKKEVEVSAVLESRSTDHDRVDNLQETRIALEHEVTELKKSQRVFYNATDEQGRQILLVELFDDEILVAEAGKQTTPRRFSATRLESGFLNRSGKPAFLDWSKQQSTSDVRFVIVIHPGTTRRFQELKQGLRDQGFSIGYDLLPRDKIAIDIQSGAR
jgi:DNA repair exonuclease SbcCD ATPase subunit